jgi:enamine deaminase RidA (YjgF/YER057c/UK114 family)
MDVDPEWLEQTSSNRPDVPPPPRLPHRTGASQLPAGAVSRGSKRAPAGSKRPARRSKAPTVVRALLPEDRVLELGLVLPPAPEPVATYATCVRHGNTLHLAGHGPLRSDGTYVVGRLGDDLDVAAGQDAARLVGLAMLATLRERLGSLDRVARILRVLAFVRCTPDFVHQPKVVNGFSDLMEEVFGEGALAARSAVGTNALPAGIAIEIEATVEIDGGE